MPAGTKFNQIMIMAYAMAPFDEFLKCNPRCQLISFVDDTYIAATAHRNSIVHIISKAVKEVQSIFQHHMGIALAHEKATSSASDKDVAKRLQKRLNHIIGHTTTTTVPNLGIDMPMPFGDPRTPQRDEAASAK